tara:strand:- start:81 stop:668 length:588 start_codon:yes stop_codon:yes gene_type:complete
MNISQEVLRERKSYLRISIDGYWDSKNIIDLFKALEYINKVAELEKFIRNSLYIMDSVRSSNAINLSVYPVYKYYDFSETELFPHYTNKKIPIKSIKYSSPGWIEIVISSGVIALFLGLIKHYVPNSEGKIRNKIQFEEYIKKRIENLKAMDVSNEEIQEIIKENNYLINSKTRVFRKFIDEGKIKDIEGFFEEI